MKAGGHVLPKNIVIFSDGTGQVGGLKPEQCLSNIYKLYRACRVDPLNDIDPAEQVAYYDPGLGTDQDAASSFSWTRGLRKLLGLASGRGISTNIIDCYEFLINHWQPGDRIWLFGFSRGAYTARCVANVISLCGVPTKDSDGAPLARFRRSTRAVAKEAVRNVYEHGAGYPLAAYEKERNEKATRFREKFGSGTDDLPNADPYFIGVFDTVAALGSRGWRRVLWLSIFTLLALALSALIAWPISFFTTSYWTPFGIVALGIGALCAAMMIIGARRTIKDYPDEGDSNTHYIRWKAENYDRSLSGRVRYARHAISVDETRADFPRVKWGKKDVIRAKEGPGDEPLIQLWFAGNHSDIGGSYPETESRLSDISLSWMIEQATDRSIPHQLKHDSRHLKLFPSADGMQHCEVLMQSQKHPLLPEFLQWKVLPRKGVLGATLHPSIEQRFKFDVVSHSGMTKPYRPDTLREDERFGTYY